MGLIASNKLFSENSSGIRVRCCHGIAAEDFGFTLIEVMIALAIFSVGILAVAAMQTNGMRSVVSAHQRLRHTTAAASSLEFFMAMAYDHGGLAPGSHGPEPLPGSPSVIEWEVEEDAPVPGAKHIRVTVRRTGQGEGQGTISFEYIKARDY